MKEYEIVIKFSNACGGESHPQTAFEEVELEDPADYICAKHGREFSRFTKEILPSGQIIYRFAGNAVTYSYEFTEI